MKTFANVILNTCTNFIFIELLHAEHEELAKKLFWESRNPKNFRLLSTLETPEQTQLLFPINDLRKYE